MNNQDNPYSSASGAGDYQMSYQSDAGGPAKENPTLNSSGQNSGQTEILDISTDQFVPEVIEASNTMPVIIDFWAPWCGPCKQLTPVLEKVAREFSGQAKLVKMNTETYPEISSQMGIQSIPAVVAFVGGKPVDAFMGVRPESEIRSFFEKHAGPSNAIDSEKVLADARELINAKDYNGAMAMLAGFLQTDPENADGLALLGSIYLKNGEREQAQNIFQSIDKSDHSKPDIAALKADLELANQADDLGEIEELIANMEKNPKDMQAKFDLSLAYNVAENFEKASDLLLDIIKQDRQWNDDGARKQLIKYFEAWGDTNEATLTARRKLSTVLFS